MGVITLELIKIARKKVRGAKEKMVIYLRIPWQRVLPFKHMKT